jgi:hypothetical protein
MVRLVNEHARHRVIVIAGLSNIVYENVFDRGAAKISYIQSLICQIPSV